MRCSRGLPPELGFASAPGLGRLEIHAVEASAPQSNELHTLLPSKTGCLGDFPLSFFKSNPETSNDKVAKLLSRSEILKLCDSAASANALTTSSPADWNAQGQD